MAEYDPQLKRMICGARRKKAPDKVCRRIPRANGRCRWCGGNAARGPAHGMYKHGKYSKYLPLRMLSAYKTGQKDPALLSLRDELALLDSRLQDLLKRVDTGESGALWKALKQAHHEFSAAKARGDVPEMHAALDAIERLISQATTDYAAWREIHIILDQRRRLARSEHRREVELQQTITQEKALALMSRIVDIVASEVHDRHVLNNIAMKIQALALQGESPVYDLPALPNAPH